MPQIVEHESLTSLDGLRSDWRRLLAETPEADHFRTLDWLGAYWRHHGEGQQLRVLQVIEDDQTVGIIPLVVRRESTKVGTVRTLTFPLDDWGSFYGPIGPDSQALLGAALEHLKTSLTDWDTIDLRWINTTDGAHDWLSRAMRDAGKAVYRRPRSIIPVARLDADWEGYWASRSGGTRSNLSRYGRKVQKLGQVEHLRFRPTEGAREDARWDLYETCEQIAAMSWQGSSTDGTTLSHESIRAHLREQHEAAVRSGGIDLNLLKIDGRAVAFQYNYFFGGRVSNLRHGFDPEMAKSGVGKVLMTMVLRDSCERGDRLYDFLPQSVEAKRRYATDLLECHSFFHSPARIGRALPLLGKRIYDDWQTGRQLTSLSADAGLVS